MKTKILLLSILLGSSLFSFGQIAKIPFQFLENNFVFIKLQINNSTDSLLFYFDTGAATTLIDSSVAQRAGLVSDYELKVDGAGGERNYLVALNQTVHLSNTIKIDSTHIVFDDLSRLEAIMGQHFDGIVGYSILKNHKTKVDFDNKVIELYSFNSEVDMKGYSELPFSLKKEICVPQFPITVTLNNGEQYTDTVLFDSGAALSLSINTPYKSKHNIKEKTGKTIVSENNNLSTTSIQEEGLIQSLQIGRFKFEKMAICLANDKKGVSSYEGYLGILGNKIINRFNFIADYHNKKLYLKPNGYFNSCFELPASGIKLKLVNGRVLVASVIKTAGAFKRGLRENFRIIAINGIKTTHLATYRSLLKKENTSVKIVYEGNNGSIQKLHLAIKNLL
jgi:hypothetical protein